MNMKVCTLRDTLFYFSIFFFFIFMKMSYFRKNETIQYVILSTGEKYKYVSMIQSLLNNQDVHTKDIHVFIDSDRPIEMDVNQHVIPKRMGNTYNDVLTHNYRYMLSTIFEKYEYAVFLEDDIFPSPDAAKYFQWGSQLMKLDDTIFAVSGTNDNSVDHLHGKYVDVFSRAEQFIGLGWMTSATVYKKYITKYLNQCPSRSTWNQCMNNALIDNSKVTVFPMIQRTLHVPYEKGTHKELAGLSFNVKHDVEYPKPYYLTKEYYNIYIERFVIPRSTTIKMDNSYHHDKKTWEKQVKRGTNVPWPISYLSKKPFGFNDDIIVYPGRTKPIVLFNKNKLSIKAKTLRQWNV